MNETTHPRIRRLAVIDSRTIDLLLGTKTMAICSMRIAKNNEKLSIHLCFDAFEWSYRQKRFGEACTKSSKNCPRTRYFAIFIF